MPQFSDDLFLGPAQTFMGTGLSQSESVFTGSIATSSNVLTVSSMLSGEPLQLGQYISGTNVTVGSYITSFGTGAGGVGTYNLSTTSTAASTTMYASGDAYLGDPAPMDLGVGPLGRVYVWDCIPQTLQTANIAASQTIAAAGSVTLTAGTSAKSIVNTYGQTVIQLNTPRALQINTSTTARSITISGYDYFGQPMSEKITVATAGTAKSGAKAFYQILSATIDGSATAVTIGTTDILGLPVRVIDAGYIVKVGWNNTLAQDAGTLVIADMTNPASNTTGDVRGTYTPSSATNGIKRLVMTIALPAIAVGPNATRTGALGVTQA